MRYADGGGLLPHGRYFDRRFDGTQHGYSDIAIGNVVGSNIFNSLGIIGASAIASGSNKFVAPENFLKFDIIAMLCITIIIGGILLYARKVGRYLGIIFLCTYLAYILISFQQM